MFKTTLKTLIASSAIVSALLLFNSDMDAAGGHRSAVFEAVPTIVTAATTRSKPRRKVSRTRRTATPRRKARQLRTRTDSTRSTRYNPYHKKPKVISGAPAQSAGQKPSSADVMAGLCNGAGGGASSHPDGTVHCVDSDGNDVLDPVPAPD